MVETADWHSDAYPELRAHPPWVMQEMIEAEPAVVAGLLGSPPADLDAAAGAVRDALRGGLPVTVCGCGTSEHAAHGIAALLAAAADPATAHLVRARPAFEAAADPAPGVCLAVSHDGETRATVLALQAAAAAGARTIVVTHRPDLAAARAADTVLVTPTHDASWCHTVAYGSALAVGASLAAAVGGLAVDAAAAERVLATASTGPAARSIAERLADRRMILCAGTGVDLVTARELALKITEATHVPAVALELETVAHGQLVAAEPTDGLLLVAITPTTDPARVSGRLAGVSAAARAIGLRVAGLLSDAFAPSAAAHTPDGALVTPLPPPDELDPRVAGLLAGAGAAQHLTLQLAHARHTNPDLIRREQAPYRLAAAAAEDATGW